MAVEAQGSMADGAASSHEVATAVAIVEGSGVHPVALHPTKVVGCGGSFTISNEDSMRTAYSNWHEEPLGVFIEAPACTRLDLQKRSLQLQLLLPMAYRVKGGKRDRLLHQHYST